MNQYTGQITDIWKMLESKNLNLYVRIDYAAILTAAEKYCMNDFQIPHWQEIVYPRRQWAFASQNIFANCFNAHFNVFDKSDTKYTVANPHDSARPFTGAFAMQSVIKQYFGETIPHAKDFEKHVRSPRAMAKFFGGIIPMPSPELKQQCGKDFVENLEDKYQGNPLNLLEEATTGQCTGRRAIRAFNNGKGLVELLTDDFGSAYRDIQKLDFDGYSYFLNFNKRAQLVAVMIHGRALDSNGILPLVEDIDEVGPIADYELPKALRAMGILKYAESLADLVDNWKEVPKDSRMEVEIRTATVAACIALINEINRLRWLEVLKHNTDYWPGLESVNICHLDYWLWKMGREAKHLRSHLTGTSAY